MTSNPDDLKKLTNIVIGIARETGKLIRSERQNMTNLDIRAKGIHDFVTHVDRKSEAYIVTELLKVLPEAGFIVEEDTRTDRGDTYDWIVDPLDGTTNFIHGLAPYSVSIALSKKEDIQLGVVHEVDSSDTYYAWKSGGAYCNGDPIMVSRTSRLENALVATGFPFTDYSRFEAFIQSLKYFMKTTHGVRRFGSAAIDLAYLANGRFDAFYEYHLNAWDVAAGTIIVREAGGMVSDFSGGDGFLFGKEIVAANALIFETFLQQVRIHMLP